MKTCSTCQHFRKIPHAGVRNGDFVLGFCHALPPTRDMAWPRTRAVDYCGVHTDNYPQFATGTPGPAPLAALTAAAPSTDQAPALNKPSARKSSRPARGELFPS